VGPPLYQYIPEAIASGFRNSMPYYILKRLGMAVMVMLLATILLASLAHIIPGDPVKLMLGPRASAEMSARIREEMGLDDPVPLQVLNFIINLLQGDLGKDFANKTPVSNMIAVALPHTITLAFTSLGMAMLFGIPLGVISATRPNSWIDRTLGVFSVSLITMPTYVGALLLLLVFAVHFGVVSSIGAGEFSDPGDYIKRLILPATALALTWVGYLARLVRASLLEVLNQNYIRTAHAYGLSEWLIHYKYALKNALIPTVAVLGVGLGDLLGGAVFTEVIFTRPGLGSLIYQSISARNFPVARGGILVAALLFVLANLLADLSYHYLDPRIRTWKSEK
jgi:peptide/nickel transport system permease protein